MKTEFFAVHCPTDTPIRLAAGIDVIKPGSPGMVFIEGRTEDYDSGRLLIAPHEALDLAKRLETVANVAISRGAAAREAQRGVA